MSLQLIHVQMHGTNQVGRCMQDLQDVAEENAVLMRECAMMSLSALDSLESDDEFSPHPEMQDGAMSIPDTASEFLTRASETDIERFQREREAREAAESGSASDDLGAESSSDDSIRPGASCTSWGQCEAPFVALQGTSHCQVFLDCAPIMSWAWVSSMCWHCQCAAST